MKSINKRYLWLPVAMMLLLATAACKSEDVSETPSTSESTTPGSSSESTGEEVPALEGAITTESGLQYFEIVAGDGETPQVGDIITMHFIGTLPDGVEFGNSYELGKPIEVVWGREQLLLGWEEGIGLMKTGGKAQIIIPPALGFGAEGFGAIPGNAFLIIEMELLSAERPPVPANAQTSDLITTESGLQYYDITIGDGNEAIQRSKVTTHYRIWVQDGDEAIYIASSYSAEPAPFTVGRGNSIFPGWDEGVHGMNQGGIRLLIIPPDLAFGEEVSSGIPANSTLIMEVELVDVEQPETIAEVNEDAYTVTESGLKFYDLKEGQGSAAAVGQTVAVHYIGWLEDGTQFDSSREIGELFSFELGAGKIIAGWDEGVIGMQVGGLRQLVIPSELGYGAAGAGNVIPPDATLIFQVELLEIQE